MKHNSAEIYEPILKDNKSKNYVDPLFFQVTIHFYNLILKGTDPLKFHFARKDKMRILLNEIASKRVVYVIKCSFTPLSDLCTNEGNHTQHKSVQNF